MEYCIYVINKVMPNCLVVVINAITISGKYLLCFLNLLVAMLMPRVVYLSGLSMLRVVYLSGLWRHCRNWVCLLTTILMNA